MILRQQPITASSGHPSERRRPWAALAAGGLRVRHGVGDTHRAEEPHAVMGEALRGAGHPQGAPPRAAAHLRELVACARVHPRVVMEIVEHSAIEMTMNVYGHVNVDAQRVALDRLDDELSG